MPKKPDAPLKPALKIFGIGHSHRLAQEICELTGLAPQLLEEEVFPDGEIKVKPLAPVAGEDVVVIHSMAAEVDKNPSEKIWELLMFISLLKDEGAATITLLLPYFSYSRSDQKKNFQDPLTLRYLAQLYEFAGVQKILTIDIHNVAAFQNAFRCPSINLEAAELFCDWIKKRNLAEAPLVVMSPDLGGIKRAERFCQKLQKSLERPVDMAIVEKYREKEGLRGQALVGRVENAQVFLYDDIISTGKTVLRAAAMARERGAKSLTVIASHGLFSADPGAILNSPLLEEVWVTNSNLSLQGSYFQGFEKLKILSCVPLLAQGLGLSSSSCENK